QYLDSAVLYFTNGRYTNDLPEIYMRKAEISFARERYEEGKTFLIQARNYLPKGQPDVRVMTALSDILSETGQADSSVKILHSSIDFYKKDQPDIRMQSFLYARLANAYLKLKKFDMAVSSGETGLKIALDNHLNKERLDNLETLVDIYKEKKDYEKAFNYFDEHRHFSDSINAITLRTTTERFQNQLRAEKNQQDIIVLEGDNEKQKFIRNAFMGGFAVVLMFAGIFFSQRNKISKARKRSDELLLNILPEETAEELKVKGSAEAKHYDEVTVMFTDFKNFTQASEQLSAAELVKEI